MPRQHINKGTTANDGTGDTLRVVADKINQSFIELYSALGDSSNVSSTVQFVDSGINFGFASESFASQLVVPQGTLTADQLMTIPDASGELVLDVNTQTVSNKTFKTTVAHRLVLKTASNDNVVLSISDVDSSHSYNVVASNLAADRVATLPALLTDDEFTFNQHTQTLTNKTLVAPGVERALLDSSAGAAVLSIIPGGSSGVNSVTVGNATSTNAPQVTATGADADIELSVTGKGDGVVRLGVMAGGVESITANGITLDATTSVHVFDISSDVSVNLEPGSPGTIKYFINNAVGLFDATINPAGGASFPQGGSVFLTQYKTTMAVNAGGTNWFFFGDSDHVL